MDALVLVFFLMNKMERPPDTVEESPESVNPKDQGPSAPGLSKPTRGEHDVPVVSIEACSRFLRIW